MVHMHRFASQVLLALLVALALSPRALGGVIVKETPAANYVEATAERLGFEVTHPYTQLVFDDKTPGESSTGNCTIYGYYDPKFLDTLPKVKTCFQSLLSTFMVLVVTGIPVWTNEYYSGIHCIFVCNEAKSSPAAAFGSALIKEKNKLVEFQEADLDSTVLASLSKSSFTDNSPGKSSTKTCTMQGFFDATVLTTTVKVRECFEARLEFLSVEGELQTETFYPTFGLDVDCVFVCKEDEVVILSDERGLSSEFKDGSSSNSVHALQNLNLWSIVFAGVLPLLAIRRP